MPMPTYSTDAVHTYTVRSPTSDASVPPQLMVSEPVHTSSYAQAVRVSSIAAQPHHVLASALGGATHSFGCYICLGS